MEATANPHVNPWVSMWTRPRATIQQIVDTDYAHFSPLVAAICGISYALDRAVFRSIGDTTSLPMIIVYAVVGGVITGLISLYVLSALIRWSGTWIGGNASSGHIRTAMAWSGVPIVWTLPLWLPQLAIFGRELFTTATPRIDDSATLLFGLMGFSVLEFTIGVWVIVLNLKSLGQVQGFSAWKALLNWLLAALFIIVPIFVIALALAQARS